MALKTKLQREVNISSREKIGVQMLPWIQVWALLNEARGWGMRNSMGSEACQRAAPFYQYQKCFIELLCLELNMKTKNAKKDQKSAPWED